MIDTAYGHQTMTPNEFLSALTDVCVGLGHKKPIVPLSSDLAYSRIRLGERGAIQRVREARQSEILKIYQGHPERDVSIVSVEWERDCPNTMRRGVTQLIVYPHGLVVSAEDLLGVWAVFRECYRPSVVKYSQED